MTPQLGFEFITGDEIPPFANEKNKQLDQVIKSKRERCDDLDIKLSQTHERVTMIKQHLDNVHNEVISTQALLDAKRQEIESEKHLHAIGQRQVGRLQSERKNVQKSIEQYQDRVNQIQSEVFRYNEKLDKFKIEMNWNQEELEQWCVAVKQKEEDQLMIEKYERVDDAKVKELNMWIEKLTMDVSARSAKLREAIESTQSLDLELRRSTANYKEQQSQRHWLLSKWEATCANSIQLDKSIAENGVQYSLGKEALAEIIDKSKKQEAFLLSEKQTNKNLQSEIEITDRLLESIRLQVVESKELLLSLSNHVTSLRSHLASQSTQLSLLNSLSQTHAVNLQTKNDGLQQVQQKKKHLSTSLANLSSVTLSKEGLLTHSQNLLAQTQEQHQALLQEIKLLKDQVYLENKNLLQTRSQEADLLSDLSSTEAAIKSMLFQIRQLDEQRQHQQNLMYRVDFEGQLMQRKVARVNGERSQEESKLLESQLTTMETHLTGQSSLVSLLTSQVRGLERDVRKGKNEIEKKEKKEKRSEEKLGQLRQEMVWMERDMGEKEKERDVLLLRRDGGVSRVGDARKGVEEKGKEACLLSNRLESFKALLTEKLSEIKAKIWEGKVALRTVQQEKHQLLLELAQRKARCGNLEGRWKSLRCANDGEEKRNNGETGTVNFIRAIQMREELQRKGDKLDEQVKIAQKEIEGLNNSLEFLTQRNQVLRKTVRTMAGGGKGSGTGEGDLSQEKLEEKNEAIDRLNLLQESLYKKKKELTELIEEEETNDVRLQEFSQRKSLLEHSIQLIERETTKIQRESRSLDESLMEDHFYHMQEMRSKSRTLFEEEAQGHSFALVEKSIQARLIKEQNEAIFGAIRQIVSLAGVEETKTLENLISQDTHLHSFFPSNVTPVQ